LPEIAGLPFGQGQIPRELEDRPLVSVIHGDDALNRFFTALTEHTFQVELGVADPPLTDYLSDVLFRFVRFENIYRIRSVVGKRLEDVAEMMVEAEQRTARPKREIHRHIGDFTLFWSGVFPEALKRLQGAEKRDHLIDYCEQGKRSYYIASTFDEEPHDNESRVLRRLSEQFELCSYGLNRVRKTAGIKPDPDAN